MRRILQASLLTSAIVAGALASATDAVWAQMGQVQDVDSLISFDSFHDQLAPYGYWLYSDRWGIVWQPADVPYDFRPYYTAGRWVYTDDYGWYWLSNFSWGEVPFHFGRWVNDPDDGWLWIPGYTWSPGWVAWRSNGAYIGWMPMPPDEAFLEGRGDIGVGVSFRFGAFDVGALYSRWYGPVFNERRFAENWVFLPAGYIAVPNYQRVVVRDPVRIVNIIRQTRNITNYTVINNIVVNKSVDVHVVERAAGHPIPSVRAATVIRHPNLVASVTVGQRVQLRMREIVPRGRGIANSAPPPPERVVAKLSASVTPRNGRAPGHLFTKATVTAPEVQNRFRGTPVRGPATGAEPAAGAMTGPNSERVRNQQPNGMTDPGGESMRSQQPNEMSGPSGAGTRSRQQNGTTGPGGERQGQSGGMNSQGVEQPNGMTGPNSERMRGDEPNGSTGPKPARSRPQQPEGMTGPGGEPNGPTSPNSERTPAQQPNGMTGSSGQPPKGMTGPNANPANGTPPRHKQKKDQQQNPPQNPPQQ